MFVNKIFSVNPIQENCYILSDETHEAVVIDDGAFYPEEVQSIEDYIVSNQLEPKHLLCTHTHFDHIWGSGKLYDKFGLKAEFCAEDAYLFDSVEEQMRQICHYAMPMYSAPAGNFIREGDIVKFGSHSLSVIATPGHTRGGVCFYCAEEKSLFSGDSLFQQSVGRTDFEGGNLDDLINSLRNKILILPDDVKVFPGHGPATEIGYEKTHNIYFRNF